jgi:hypothetical protein
VHPALSDVLAALDQSRERLRAAVDGVPAALRDHRPGAERWSVAGVVEHLALVEQRFTALLGGKLESARAAGLGLEGDSPLLLSADMRTRLMDRSERRQAPEPTHPTGLDCSAAWQRAEAARAAFRRLISAADGLALGGVIHEHPRFGAMNVYQWAGFLAAHETRHSVQIREIAGVLP